jgi:alcohol dehydrogenase
MQSSFYFAGRISNFFSPNKIVLGVGAARTVGVEAKLLGAKKAMIITDPGLTKTGLVEGINEALAAEKIDVLVYDKAEFETPARVIDACAKIARAEQRDLVIGLGGGTVLDTTKGVSIMCTNKGKVLDYMGLDLVPLKGLPKILIPTTAGSGSEVTRVLALTDEAKHIKTIVYTSYNLAELAILDPMLTLSLPPTLTAATGIDALTHAIESYVCVNASPFSEVLAMEAIRLVGKSLLTAYAKGQTVEARYDMQVAANLAGLAFSSSGLGAVHALSLTLEGEHRVEHAKAISAMLPHVMAYNSIGALEKYGAIAQALGEDIEGLSSAEAAETAVMAILRLLKTMNLSTRLMDFGITEEDVPPLVTEAMKQTRLFALNPRNLAEKDVREIYLKAME